MFSLICAWINGSRSKKSWGWWFETPSYSLWRNRIMQRLIKHLKLWWSDWNSIRISQVIINYLINHYSDVIMGTMASQTISPTIVYSTVYSGADQRKHQSSAPLAFVRGIHRWPANSPVTCEFPAQRASNAENISIWWRHHVNMNPTWYPGASWWFFFQINTSLCISCRFGIY